MVYHRVQRATPTARESKTGSFGRLCTPEPLTSGAGRPPRSRPTGRSAEMLEPLGEHEQIPKLGAVRSSVVMLVQQLVHRTRLNDLRVDERASVQLRLEPPAQLAPEPLVYWQGKAHLRAVEEARRKLGTEELLHDAFGTISVALKSGGQFHRQLDDCGVQKRRPGL